MKKLFSLIVIGFIFSGILFLVGCQKKVEGKKVVKIGAILPLTGPLSTYGEPVKEGMLLAVEELNSKAKKVKLIMEDSQSDPKEAINAFSKLADFNKIQVIVGPLSSGNSMATAPLANKNRVVQISTLASIPALSEAGEYVFRLYPSTTIAARYVVRKAYEIFKPKKVAIIYMNNPFGQTAQQIYKKSMESLGVNVVLLENYQDGEQDFRSLLQKVKDAKPDLILCSAYWVEGAKMLRQMIELGIKIPIMGEDGWFGPIADKVGEEGLKLLYFENVAFGPKIKNRVMQRFIERYEKNYNKRATTYAAAGYDGILIAYKAIKEVGNNGEAVKKYFHHLNYTGALGEIKFDRHGDNIGTEMAIFQLNAKNEPVLIAY